ncbi:hypothetical protein HD554DRAFT_2037720 [Boletus coccyginus]|nr:hypothetical protein HD554DRAFT_2037720 [Boletus coccyginus]
MPHNLPCYQDHTECNQEYIHQKLLQLIGDLNCLSRIFISQHTSGDLINNLPEAKIVRWTDPEVDVLIKYLHQHHAQHGGRSFKDTTFTDATEHIKHLHVLDKIKNVFSSLNLFTLASQTIEDNQDFTGTMRTGRIYRVLVLLKSSTLTSQESGWRYLEQMEDIIPLGSANGAQLSYRGTVDVSHISSAIPWTVSGTHTSNSALITPGSSSAATSGNAQLRDLAPAVVPSSHASKCSQISAAPKDDQQSNIVAINMFRDKLATISSTTDQLYHIDGLTQDQIVDLGEHFAEHETKASVFLSLWLEERVIYANKLYNCYCTPSS